MRERRPKNVTFEQIYNTALDLFQGDRDKTWRWWMTPSVHFENKTPYAFAKEGNAMKVLKILRNGMKL